MTEDELAEIRERLEKATPGPWEADVFRRKISELESMVMNAYIAGFEAGEEGVIDLVSSRLPDFPSELRGDAIACFERDFPEYPSTTS